MVLLAKPGCKNASPRDNGNVCWPLTHRQDHRGGRKRRARIRPRRTAGQMPRARHKPKAAPGDPKTGAKNNFTKLRSGKKLGKPDELCFNVASATDEEPPPGVNGADGLKPAGDDATRESASAALRGSGLDTADAAQICQGSQRHARLSHGRDEPAPRDADDPPEVPPAA